MDETKTLYSGIAVGGPLEGKTVEGRFPNGIVFVSKIQNRAWVYDFFADQNKFYARPLGYDAVWDEMSTAQKLEVLSQTTLAGVDATRELNGEKVSAAAEGSTYEVRALPEDGDK